MENVSMLNQKINLATLCLRLCEEMEEHYADSSYQLKPVPKDGAFGKDVAIGEDIYRALYAAMCGMIDTFHKGNDEIVISTYQTGIVIAGLEIASKDLYDLCSVEKRQISDTEKQAWHSAGISKTGAGENRTGLRKKEGWYWFRFSKGDLKD